MGGVDGGGVDDNVSAGGGGGEGEGVVTSRASRGGEGNDVGKAIALFHAVLSPPAALGAAALPPASPMACRRGVGACDSWRRAIVCAARAREAAIAVEDSRRAGTPAAIAIPR